MDFRPLRSLHQVPGLSILEGITTLKNPAFPHILLAITTVLFQTPHAAPTFVFTSLPILIHLAESQSTWDFAKKTLGPLIGYLTVDSLTTTRGLLASPGQVLLGQTALSFGIALTSWLAVFLHRQAIRAGALSEGKWDTTLAFGLLWAAAWLAFSWVSPFGRYVGPPCTSTAHLPLMPPGRTLTIPSRHTQSRTGSTLHRYHRNRPSTRFSSVCGLPYRGGLVQGPASHRQWLKPRDAPEARTPTSTSTSSRQTFNFPSPHRTASSAAARSTPSSTEDSSSSSTRASHSTQANSTPPTSPEIGGDSSSHWSKHIKKTAIALGAMGLVSTALPEPPLSSTSATLAEQTPFGLGFVLPPGKAKWQIADLIREAQMIGNRANLLVFPESAYYAASADDRQKVIDQFVRGRASYAGVSSLQRYPQRMPDKKTNEVVLIGPQGVVGSYAKQKLIPYVESFPFHRGLMRVPVWEIPLPSPPGVTKTDWTPSIPYHRLIGISPLICLDTFHPDILSSLDTPPDLFTVSASALNRPIARHVVGQAESIAISHSAPVMVVSGSRGRAEQGISVLLDSWGRVIHQQAGGRSFVVQVSLPYYGQRGRRQAGALGSSGVLGAGIILLSVGSALRPRNRRKFKFKRLNDFPMKVFRYIARSNRDETASNPSTSKRTKSAYGSVETAPSLRRSTSMKRARRTSYDRLIDVESVAGSEAWS